MQPYLRDAVRTDIPAIGAILRTTDAATRTTGPPTGDESPVGSYRDALTEIDRTDGNYVLVAEYDRQIVAVLQLLAFRQLHARGERTAQIVLLRVAEAYRTTGAGAMLLDHAVLRARDLGCRRIRAVVATDADDHAFWERSGFVHLERAYVRPLD